MRMVLGIATREWSGWLWCVDSWKEQARFTYPMDFVFGKDVMPAFQDILGRAFCEDIIALIHDDVRIYEAQWDVRVLRQFKDPAVGVVGFGGALGHGHPDLYNVPYHLPNLARQSFMSNMTSAEKHGARFHGERDVAILDGFALFIRRSILDKVGGWPVDKPYGYFMYSEWLCCEARRQGFRIRLVGVDCEHLGGKSSGFISPKENYEEAHRYFYEHNRDVMPWRVPE
jgi:GT2 family glycosyltransferase